VGLLDDLTSPPKERYAVSNDIVVQLIQPGAFQHQLTNSPKSCAVVRAVEGEAFLARRAVLETNDGRTRVVRHGHLPQREVMTGIGSVAVRQPRVRER
jgi:putative transposase